MKMYERAFKVLEESINEFDSIYGKGHQKMEEMYAILTMNIQEVAVKLGLLKKA